MRHYNLFSEHIWQKYSLNYNSKLRKLTWSFTYFVNINLKQMLALKPLFEGGVVHQHWKFFRFRPPCFNTELTNCVLLHLASWKGTQQVQIPKAGHSASTLFWTALQHLCSPRCAVRVACDYAVVASATQSPAHPWVDERKVSEHVLVDAVDECSVSGRQPRLFVDELFVEVAVVTWRHLQVRRERTGNTLIKLYL